MAIDVDPPENFLDLFKEGTKWVDKNGILTSEARHYLEADHRQKTDQWERSGGSDDTVSDVESNNSSDNSVLGQIAQLRKTIEDLASQITRTNVEFAIMQKRYNDLELQQ
jgi:hypothetical protein